MGSEHRPDSTHPVETEDKRRDVHMEYETKGEYDDEGVMKCSQEGVIRDQKSHDISRDHEPYRGCEEKP